MIPERLRELIAAGESLDVEFKGEEARELSDAGLVEAELLHLSAATYRRLGKRVAYLRQHGFEPLQQEQMVLRYVAKHGRITRRDVAALCQLRGVQASRMLQLLVEKGKLRRIGNWGCGVEYERPSK